MNTDKIDELLHAAAEEIKSQVVAQVEAWRQVPYWTLEAEGRGGWLDHAHIAYTHGLLGIGCWPHTVFVELSSGKLVGYTGGEIADKAIVEAYFMSPSCFDASYRLSCLVARATNGKDTFNKAQNDLAREELRQEHKMPTVWTGPTKPIKYRISVGF